MKNTLKYISAIVTILAATISLWFLLNNLQPLSPGLYSFAIICILAAILSFKLFAGNLVNKLSIVTKRITSFKYFIFFVIPILLLVSIAIRLYFYFNYSYTPVSDPITFFQAGQKIAEGGGLVGDSYAALFPYLAAYNSVLGFAMSLISDPWLATIVLNTVFDIGAAFAVYFVVKRLSKPGSILPIIAFGTWLLSPFNILFSMISIPVIVVNFFIIITLLLALLLIESLKSKKLIPSLLLGALLAITMSLGNSFRPVFIIALLALFLVFSYIFFTSKSRTKLPLLLVSTFILISAIFFSSQHLSLALVSKATGIEAASNSSGWSIFVGANSESDGRWNRADEIRLNILCADTKSYEECHEILRNAGIDRYKEQGIAGTVNLFIRKLYVFSTNQNNLYNANLSIDNYANSKTQKTFNLFITLFLITLFILSFRFFYQSSKETIAHRQMSAEVLFIALLTVGFFASAMLVETSERYAQIMYPLFITTAILGLSSWKDSPVKKNKSRLFK